MPHYAKARHNLAVALMEQNNLDAAERHLDTILERQPNYVPALISRADVLGRKDRIERRQDLDIRVGKVE